MTLVGPGGRIASLDGLRAVSIGMVILAHLAGSHHFPVSSLRSVGDLGNLGVRVFFVISGFLITTLLIEEANANGRISLKAFYIRRFFRIFPAFYAYVGVVALCEVARLLQLKPGDLAHAVSYTINYHYDRAWWLGHIWSLSVEEQFYLLWPAVLVIFGVRRGIYAAVGVLAAAPLIRAGIHLFVPWGRPSIGESFPTVADALAVGCVLAGIQDRLATCKWYTRVISSRWFMAVPAMALITNYLQPWARFSLLFGTTIINVSIAVTVHRCIRVPHGLSGRVLNSRPLVVVGILSYSIYLWQQPFLNRHSSSPIAAFPLNLLLVAAASLCSYALIEKPFLRMRKRFERRREYSAARSGAPAGVAAE